MDYQFKNLVFEGGGVKGIAYVGALEVLNNLGVIEKVERVGGTSAGAINAVLVGLGYTLDETKDIMWSLDFNKFMDDSWGFIQDTKRLIEEFGWYKGDFFRDWIARLIEQKTGNAESTFADIEDLKSSRKFKSLYFMATNLSTRFSEVFSAEHTPAACIADAVRKSMSIPLFFAAKRNNLGDVYVDGGVLDNYPVKLFDRKKYVSPAKSIIPDYYKTINKNLGLNGRTGSQYVFNKETLGFRLDSKDEISMFKDHKAPKHIKIDNFFDYTWGLIETIMQAQDNSHLHNDDWERTIYIDTKGVGTTDFSINSEKKNALVLSGKDGAEQFFKWYNGKTV